MPKPNDNQASVDEADSTNSNKLEKHVDTGKVVPEEVEPNDNQASVDEVDLTNINKLVEYIKSGKTVPEEVKRKINFMNCKLNESAEEHDAGKRDGSLGAIPKRKHAPTMSIKRIDGATSTANHKGGSTKIAQDESVSDSSRKSGTISSISDSESDSIRDTSEIEGSDSSNTEYEQLRKRRKSRKNRDKPSIDHLVKAMNKLGAKKVPDMEKFDEKSGQELKQYLKSFEQFCTKTLYCDKDLWLGQLEHNLSGKILNARSERFVS